MSFTICILAAIIICFYSPFVTAFPTAQFEEWYPELGKILNRTLREKCTAELDYYRSGRVNNTRLELYDYFSGATLRSALAQPVASCILNNTSDWIKSGMASAAVVLGLAPAILACLGPSIEETSTLFIIARRPLLVMCLAAGSPAVNPIRAMENRDPLDILKSRKKGYELPNWTDRTHKFIMLVEYIMVGLAIANMATLGLELGFKVIYNFAPQSIYLPILWAYLGSLAHIAGAVALKFRVRRVKYSGDDKSLNWFNAQFKPLALQKAAHYETDDESWISVVLSWVTSVGVACHIIFGTLTFSSVLFISVKDSVTVMLRFMASVVVCRCVLMYELTILKSQEKIRQRTEESELGSLIKHNRGISE
jgi:hypothetical protein